MMAAAVGVELHDVPRTRDIGVTRTRTSRRHQRSVNEDRSNYITTQAYSGRRLSTLADLRACFMASTPRHSVARSTPATASATSPLPLRSSEDGIIRSRRPTARTKRPAGKSVWRGPRSTAGSHALSSRPFDITSTCSSRPVGGRTLCNSRLSSFMLLFCLCSLSY
jgi:hypothetical protein